VQILNLNFKFSAPKQHLHCQVDDCFRNVEFLQSVHLGYEIHFHTLSNFCQLKDFPNGEQEKISYVIHRLLTWKVMEKIWFFVLLKSLLSLLKFELKGIVSTVLYCVHLKGLLN